MYIGSSACYYTDADDVEDHKNSSVVIHLMSGGFSFDNITMQDRFSNDPFLTTSTLLPDNIFGTNLMSSDPATNPSFAEGFVHTFVPYCSSDLWLGSAQSISSNTLSNNINDTTTPPVGKLDVDFLGHYIVEAVLTEMIGSYLSPTPSITDSAAYSDGGGVVILSGASAGGIGVSNHIDVSVWTCKYIYKEGSLYFNILYFEISMPRMYCVSHTPLPISIHICI